MYQYRFRNIIAIVNIHVVAMSFHNIKMQRITKHKGGGGCGLSLTLKLISSDVSESDFESCDSTMTYNYRVASVVLPW